MSIFQAIILGIAQGITEVLPISSSGHLVIIPWILGWVEHPLLFDIILHTATFFAILIYFRRDWIEILREGFLGMREKNLRGPIVRKLFWYIIIASIPGVILGGIFEKRIEYYFRNPESIALALGIFGLILYFADVYGKKNRSLRDMTWQLAFLIGLSQMLAFFPGVSRSGITISAALLLGMNRESSVRFSFLLGAPIIFAAVCYSMGSLASVSDSLPYTVLSSGFLVAFLSSMAVIHFLLNYVKKSPFAIFVAYRVALSLLILLCRRPA